ncbi:MAG TPA: protoporphyrinogen oxidase [Terriglobales bacterium]|jgi:oxygen-dependent protoporphyrinogen oxidase|nr:protoporphyrinogen oxidase [Terriglobales bacterium]
MRKVAIIGGGISGLSAAYYLEKARRNGAPLEWRLFEQSPRLGGIVGSEYLNGCVIETGADSFLSEKPWAFDLCRELGLEDQLIGSNDAARKTFILLHGKLVPLPEGLQFIVPVSLESVMRSELFSEETRRLIAAEVNLPPRRNEGDESVAAFVARHFGDEVVDRLAGPMLAGVYGGDIAKLSMRTIMPRFLKMEEEHGSLIRALQASAGKKSPRPIFTSLKNGMQQLLDAIAARLDPNTILTQRVITAVVKSQNGKITRWKLQGIGFTEEFDALILAIPAYASAHLLQSCCPELVRELGKIPYSSSVIVTLAFPKREFDKHDVHPEGFGFLVPASEKSRLLACTFVGNKFQHRQADGLVLLRGVLGGAHDEAALALSDAEAVAIVQREVAEILGINNGIHSQPVFTRVFRWPRSMPQYEVGHLERVACIEHLRKNVPGVYLIGNAYRGVGVPDCIREGRDAAEKILAAFPSN